MPAPEQTAKRLAQLDELRSMARQSLASGAEYLAALERERDQLVALGLVDAPTRPRAAAKYMSRVQAAEYLAVSVGTLDAWRYANRGPSFAHAGRRVLYESSALDAFVAAGSSER